MAAHRWPAFIDAQVWPTTDASTESLRRDALMLIVAFRDEIAQLAKWADPSHLRELGNIARQAARDFGQVGAEAHTAADQFVTNGPGVKHPDDLDESPWED